ncbi:MAG: Coenzyme F420 hydrogenase/dehydrogenase, beta subunit C-terminal domain [Rikenellaceae bacterium]
MIKIQSKDRCCGCGACQQVCPTNCISLAEDQEGFLYPRVDVLRCVECGRCEHVCPLIHRAPKRRPLNIYAAKSRCDTTREQSSSGGLFTLLANRIIEVGGVVFGAKFTDRWELEQAAAETIDAVAPLRGSKYLQSRTGDTSTRVKCELQSGRDVMYVGTPCQIAGLKRFLSKDYDNLLTVDFICHGVASPKVWRRYLGELSSGGSSDFITAISFRNKELGWRNYCFKIWAKDNTPDKPDQLIVNEHFADNIYMRGFLSSLYLRPSCYSCQAKDGRSRSDITLADYWGVATSRPEFDDDRGVSAVMINSAKGRQYYPQNQVIAFDLTLEESRVDNGGFLPYRPMHPQRSRFFKGVDSALSMSEHIARHAATRPRYARIYSKVVARLKNMLS